MGWNPLDFLRRTASVLIDVVGNALAQLRPSSRTSALSVAPRGLPLLLSIGAALVLIGCGGGGSSDSPAGSSGPTGTTNPPTLQSIALTPGTSNLAIGQTTPVVAHGTYSDGTTHSLTSGVTWSSTNAAVATTDSTGLVRAVSAGTATIAASVGSISSVTTITVPAATLQSLLVAPASQNIVVGQGIQMVATGTFSDGASRVLTNEIAWKSESTDVASISSSGSVVGLQSGSVVITATVGTVSSSASIVVLAPVLQSISISPAVSSIAANQTIQMIATGIYSDGVSRSITTGLVWTSSGVSIITVDQTGLVRGVSAGTATIQASLGGVTTSTSLTVPAAVVQSIAVAPQSSTVAIGQTLQLSVTATYSDGTTRPLNVGISWNSTNTSAATVDQFGLVRGIAAGTASIRATIGSLSTTSNISVPAATLLSLTTSPSAHSIKVTQTVQLSLTGTYSDGGNRALTSGVSWSSSNTAIATVDQSGLVRGVAAGSAIVSASLDGKVGTASVSVLPVSLYTYTYEGPNVGTPGTIITPLGDGPRNVEIAIATTLPLTSSRTYTSKTEIPGLVASSSYIRITGNGGWTAPLPDNNSLQLHTNALGMIDAWYVSSATYENPATQPLGVRRDIHSRNTLLAPLPVLSTPPEAWDSVNSQTYYQPCGSAPQGSVCVDLGGWGYVVIYWYQVLPSNTTTANWTLHVN